MAKKRRRPAKTKAKAAKSKPATSNKTTKPAKPKPVLTMPPTIEPAADAPSGYGYVTKEIRQIALIVLSFVGFQLLLWFVLTNTGLEDKLASLISL